MGASQSRYNSSSAADLMIPSLHSIRSPDEAQEVIKLLGQLLCELQSQGQSGQQDRFEKQWKKEFYAQRGRHAVHQDHSEARHRAKRRDCEPWEEGRSSCRAARRIEEELRFLKRQFEEHERQLREQQADRTRERQRQDDRRNDFVRERERDIQKQWDRDRERDRDRDKDRERERDRDRERDRLRWDRIYLDPPFAPFQPRELQHRQPAMRQVPMAAFDMPDFEPPMPSMRPMMPRRQRYGQPIAAMPMDWGGAAGPRAGPFAAAGPWGGGGAFEDEFGMRGPHRRRPKRRFDQNQPDIGQMPPNIRFPTPKPFAAPRMATAGVPPAEPAQPQPATAADNASYQRFRPGGRAAQPGQRADRAEVPLGPLPPWGVPDEPIQEEAQGGGKDILEDFFGPALGHGGQNSGGATHDPFKSAGPGPRSRRRQQFSQFQQFFPDGAGSNNGAEGGGGSAHDVNGRGAMGQDSLNRVQEVSSDDDDNDNHDDEVRGSGGQQ